MAQEIGRLIENYPTVWEILRLVFTALVTGAVLIVLLRLEKKAAGRFLEKKNKLNARFVENVIRFVLILLAFLIEKYVCIHWDLHLEYIVTGIICFEQAWSILENESSCREDEDSRIYRMLQRIMVDKSERHFDVELDEELSAERKNAKMKKCKNTRG